MSVRFCLNCRDLAASRAFYSRIARRGDDIAHDDGARWFTVELAPGVSLKIESRPNASTGNAHVEFLAFDVWALWNRVEGILPAHAATVDTLPPGHACGPHEFPGGYLLNLRDPDGHVLSFSTW